MATPQRAVSIAEEGSDATVGAFGVAVVSNGVAELPSKIAHPAAVSGDHGVVVAGDRARAIAGKDAAAIGADGSHVTVGDGGVAKAGYNSHAYSELTSVSMVVDRGFALSREDGIAICRGGVSEVVVRGVACATSRVPGDGERGIAIAHDNAVAIAFNEGTVVRVGAGGALLGFHRAENTTRLVVEIIDGHDRLRADTFYIFQGGRFESLTAEESQRVAADLISWKDVWSKQERD